MKNFKGGVAVFAAGGGHRGAEEEDFSVKCQRSLLDISTRRPWLQLEAGVDRLFLEGQRVNL